MRIYHIYYKINFDRLHFAWSNLDDAGQETAPFFNKAFNFDNYYWRQYAENKDFCLEKEWELKHSN